MPVFFPAGIQLSAFLFAERTMDFNTLEGKIEQEIVIYLQFSSFLQEKACRVHKFQQTHDGLLQSYQNRGKRNCCVCIVLCYNTYKNLRTLKCLTPHFIPWFSFQSVPFPFIWTRNQPSSTTIWRLTSNIQVILCSILPFYRNAYLYYLNIFNLIPNHITPRISVFSKFSSCKQNHAMLVLWREQTLPPIQRIRSPASQTAALCSSWLLSLQQSGGLAAALLTLAKPAAVFLSSAD